ncbi:MAG TPA: prolyl oligopeptidase family serine peptidase [Stellaceae bacterium]|nr:prolyl oligopeptidase family serine peptidase [Stellaceae bacterium]
MAEPRITPYGSWASPITSDLIVASSIGLGDILVDGSGVYWIESRPQEQGRSVIVRCSRDGRPADVTPPMPASGQGAFNVRTRVHEYGGGAYLVSDGVVYFSNDADQRLYRQERGASPVAITEAPLKPRGVRYADGVMDAVRGRMIWVCEDHQTGSEQPINTLVDIPLDGSRPHRTLVAGKDFYAAPRLSPDSTRVAWLEWGHPNMPWDGTELWVGRCAADGTIAEKRQVAGGDAESILQPEWSPEGVLYFVSDRSGWWNLYRIAGDPLIVSNEIETIYPLEAEFGSAQWGFRPSRYAFASAQRLICSYSRDGSASLAVVDLTTLAVTPIATEFTEIGSLRADADHAYFVGASPTHFSAIVKLAPSSGGVSILKLSNTEDVRAFEGYLSTPQSIEFPTENELTAFGLLYPPVNRDYSAQPGELPPLIVRSHGGPTSAFSSALDWSVQYWTSRGFAVMNVNYGGSTGYGRAYRERLRGQWGIVDVDDCVNGARHLAASGKVDGRRMAIRGGSAGGYTTLCALTFRNVFATGASYYGVSDLEALAKDTHKFESRYLDGLIGPYPARRDIYIERSPVHFTERLSVPIAFFQGAEDPIVPPNQAEAMVEALKAKGVPFQYLLFDGEQHGFRRAQTIKRTLDAELYFYSIFLTATKLVFAIES